MIIVNGVKYITLDDELFVNGKKVLEAYANGEKVYPDDRSTYFKIDADLEWSGMVNGPTVGMIGVYEFPFKLGPVDITFHRTIYLRTRDPMTYGDLIDVIDQANSGYYIQNFSAKTVDDNFSVQTDTNMLNNWGDFAGIEYTSSGWRVSIDKGEIVVPGLEAQDIQNISVVNYKYDENGTIVVTGYLVSGEIYRVQLIELDANEQTITVPAYAFNRTKKYNNYYYETGGEITIPPCIVPEKLPVLLLDDSRQLTIRSGFTLNYVYRQEYVKSGFSLLSPAAGALEISYVLKSMTNDSYYGIDDAKATNCTVTTISRDEYNAIDEASTSVLVYKV